LTNPNSGEINALRDPATHTYLYRELSLILHSQEHTLTDYLYKLFLISINFAKLRQSKSYPVFKALLHRVKIHSCEVLYSSCLSISRLRALLSYLELAANIEDESLLSDHIPKNVKRHLTTNDMRYQNYDPAYESPPGVTGEETDEELEKFALLTLRKIEVNKPETANEVPKYLYRLLTVIYT
jgi:hypothetical protein